MEAGLICSEYSTHKDHLCTRLLLNRQNLSARSPRNENVNNDSISA